MGRRDITMARQVYIDANDFLVDPPKKFFRLSPGQEVRLRYAYAIKCNEVIYGDDGCTPVELRCTYDKETRQGKGRKIKGVVHWVPADPELSVPISVRLWDRLFATAVPGARTEPTTGEDGADDTRDYVDDVNTASREDIIGYGERSLADAAPGRQFQFERVGYFSTDTKDSSPEKLVFNRVVTLRDTWGKVAGKL